MNTNNPVDWPAIRAEYESGLSQRSLALKYSIEQSTISRRATKENWRITPRITPAPESITDASDILTLVEAALRNLAKLDPENFLTLNEHKLFADALNQYNKIKLTLPATEDNYAAYDMREFLASCTPEELATVNPIIKAVAARKAEQEEDKIRPLRRQG